MESKGIVVSYLVYPTVLEFLGDSLTFGESVGCCTSRFETGLVEDIGLFDITPAKVGIRNSKVVENRVADRLVDNLLQKGQLRIELCNLGLSDVLSKCYIVDFLNEKRRRTALIILTENIVDIILRTVVKGYCISYNSFLSVILCNLKDKFAEVIRGNIKCTVGC